MDTPLTLIEQGIIGILAFIILVLIGVLIKIYFSSVEQTENYATTITDVAKEGEVALLETSSAIGTIRETVKDLTNRFSSRLKRIESIVQIKVFYFVDSVMI